MLTTEQATLVRNDILADPVWSQMPPGSSTAFEIAAQYDAATNPPFIVWRSAITKEEIYANGFDWVAVDDVTEPKWRVWQAMFDNSRGAMNPSKVNVRAGIVEVWKGNAAKLAVQAYVLAKCKRTATRLEKLLATGTGSDASPAVMGYEGGVSYNDIKDAMGW